MNRKCLYIVVYYIKYIELITKNSVAQNKLALSYRRVRGQYFLLVIFTATIVESGSAYKCCVRFAGKMMYNK